MRRGLLSCITLTLTLLVLCAGSFSHAATSRGDVNGDGVMGSADATMILRYLAGMARLDKGQLARGDVDGDLRVTASDASAILRLCTGLKTEIAACNVELTLIASANLQGELWDRNGFSGEHGKENAAKLSTYIKYERNHNSNLLVVDGGNSLYGSTFSNLYAKLSQGINMGVMGSFFTALSYDAVLLSHKDFALGMPTLRADSGFLLSSGVDVLCANYLKNDPTTADVPYAPWNDCKPYVIREYSNRYGEVISVGIIGLGTEAIENGAYSYEGVNGVDARSMVDVYLYYEAELRAKCDVMIALVNAPIDADALATDYGSTAELVAQSSGLDFVLCAGEANTGMLTRRDALGREVTLIGLPTSAAYVCKIDLSYNSYNNRLVLKPEYVTTTEFSDDTTLLKGLNHHSAIANALYMLELGQLSESIDLVKDYHSPNAWMELIHQSQLWALRDWQESTGCDLPDTLLSVAYPYMSCTSNLPAGTLGLGSLLSRAAGKANISVMLLRGWELRAWLDAYATEIERDELPYSVYGIKYKLYPQEDEGARLEGFTVYLGQVVADNDIVGVIVSEKGEIGSLFAPYLDYEWMSLEDRILDFVPPSFSANLEGDYSACQLMACYISSEHAVRAYGMDNWSIVRE